MDGQKLSGQFILIILTIFLDFYTPYAYLPNGGSAIDTGIIHHFPSLHCSSKAKSSVITDTLDK